MEILEGSVQADHLHLVLSFPPKYSILEVVGFLKGKNAIKIFDINSELKKRYWGGHFWEAPHFIAGRFTGYYQKGGHPLHTWVG